MAAVVVEQFVQVGDRVFLYDVVQAAIVDRQ